MVKPWHHLVVMLLREEAVWKTVTLVKIRRIKSSTSLRSEGETRTDQSSCWTFFVFLIPHARWNISWTWFISHVHLIESPQQTFKNWKAHSKGNLKVAFIADQIQICYCQAARARGFRLEPLATLDAHHRPVTGLYVPPCSTNLLLNPV